MAEITFFAEDFGHEQFVGALIRRIGNELGEDIDLVTRNAVGGRPRLLLELRAFVRDLEAGISPLGDAVVIATDANCKGRAHWLRVIREECEYILRRDPGVLVPVIPHPHVERWMLVDSAAFRQVFGRGCRAPAAKCDRDRYKEHLLIDIEAAGIEPQLGGMEFAEDYVQALDLNRVIPRDHSLGAAIQDIRNRLNALGRR